MWHLLAFRRFPAGFRRRRCRRHRRRQPPAAAALSPSLPPGRRRRCRHPLRSARPASSVHPNCPPGLSDQTVRTPGAPARPSATKCSKTANLCSKMKQTNSSYIFVVRIRRMNSFFRDSQKFRRTISSHGRFFFVAPFRRMDVAFSSYAWAAGATVAAAGCRLQAAGCKLLPAGCWVQLASCRLHAARLCKISCTGMPAQACLCCDCTSMLAQTCLCRNSCTDAGTGVPVQELLQGRQRVQTALVL